MKKTLDLTKPLQTVAGQSVTLITTEGRAPYSLVGYITDSDIVRTWTAEGFCKVASVSQMDLVNVEEDLISDQDVHDLGMRLIKVLHLKRGPLGKVSTDLGYKTPIGLARLVLSVLKAYPNVSSE